MSALGELVYDGTEEQKVNERPAKAQSVSGLHTLKVCALHSPDEERPWCGGDVGFLAGVVDVARARNGVNVGPQEEEEDQDVYDLRRGQRPPAWTCSQHTHLEQDAVRPAVCHGGGSCLRRVVATGQGQPTR